MKNPFLILLGVGLLTVPWSMAMAKSVDSTWPQKPVIIDGRGSEWQLMPVLETDGFSFRAMNDQDHVYLLISAITDDGRTILAGTFGQDVTLWVLGTDKKTRLWGLRIPFSARDHGTGHINPDNSTLSSLGIAPEKVIQEGVEVSTSAWPDAIAVEGDLSSRYGRKPVVEWSVPLELFASSRKGKSIFLQLTAEPVTPEIKREVAIETSDTHSDSATTPSPASSSGGASPSGGGGGRHGGRHGGGGGGQGGGGKPKSNGVIEVPNPVQVSFTVDLVTHSPR